MDSILKVPAMIADELRAGLLSILRQAASDVSTAMDKGRLFHPQRLDDPLQRMDCARALLELIGWTQMHKPETVLIDLDIHRWAFVNGLEWALVVGCEDIEAEERDTCRHTDENKRDRDIVRLLVLRQYLGNIEIQFTAYDVAAGCRS